MRHSSTSSWRLRVPRLKPTPRLALLLLVLCVAVFCAAVRLIWLSATSRAVAACENSAMQIRTAITAIPQDRNGFEKLDLKDFTKN